MVIGYHLIFTAYGWSLPIWMQIAFGGGMKGEQAKQPEPLKVAA